MINDWLGMVPNASEHGVHIGQMLEFVHWVMLVLFVGWSLFFVYVLYRFRRRKHPVADYYGAKTKLTTHIEVSVVIVEAVLLFGFAFPLWARRVNEFPTQAAERVRVVGQQFSWNFHYSGADGKFGRQSVDLMDASNPLGLDRSDPDCRDDIVTMNDLHLPVGKPAILELMSRDVIHNLALPNMRIAHDAIPGQSIPMWFTPVKTGSYEIVCGQLCGLGHYSMRAMLTVETPEEYANWLKQMASLIPVAEPAPAQAPPSEAAPAAEAAGHTGA